MGKAVIENGIMESYEFTMPGNVKITVEEGVKAFGERCFFEQKKLTRLILPSTLESLGGWCLSGSGIKKLEIPEGTKAVTEHAAANCRSLRSVRLPSTLTELSGNCFENCPVLEEVLLAADGLEFVPEEVFKGCPQVSVYLTDKDGEPIRRLYAGAEVGKKPDPADAGQDSFTIRNDVLSEITLPAGEEIRVTLPEGIRRCSEKLLKGEQRVTELILPESIEALTGWEFAGTGIREIRLPEGLKTLEGHVFDGCSELRRVLLPASLSEVGDEAFANCPKLEAVLCAGGEKLISKTAFAGAQKPWIVPCAENGEPVIPEGFTVTDGVLETVGDAAVQDGTLTLPYGICRIAPELLKDRAEITELILPPGLEKLDGWTLSGTGIREIRLPESLKRLEGHVFENCAALEAVVLPSEMTALHGEVFRNCPKLRHIFCGSAQLAWEDGCFDAGHVPEILERRPFSERRDYGGMTFSDDLFEVGNGVLLRYKGDESLTEVEIPEGVQCISTACFKDMANITSVIFPETLRELVGWEFAGTGLTEVWLPDSLRDLDGHCFEGCKALQTVYLPRHMSRFGTEGHCACFRGCEQLGKIYYASEKVTYFNSAFEGCPHFLLVQKFRSAKPKKTETAVEEAPQPARVPEPAAEPTVMPEDTAHPAAGSELEQRYLAEIETLQETIGSLEAQQQNLLREKEQYEADIAHREETETLRRQIVAADAEKARMEAELRLQRERRVLEEQAADLQNRLRIAEVRHYAAEAALEQMLLAFAEDAPEESRDAMIRLLQEAAARLLRGDDDAVPLLCNALNNGESGDVEGDTDGEV